MRNILLVGNLTKDVYLRLDPQSNNFETDAEKVDWLDLAFDGSSHDYFSRVAVFGGVGISLEICKRFNLDASIMDSATSFDNGELIVPEPSKVAHRYVLCRDQDVSYFSPSHFPENRWQEPARTPDWVYIDRSAKLSADFTTHLLDYLASHHDCQLAYFVSSRSNQGASHIKKLISRANLIITDVTLSEHPAKVVEIRPESIIFDGQQIDWSMQEKDNFMTHLSSHSIIAASFFAAIVQEKTAATALLLAKTNVEQAKLSGTANLTKLEEQISGKDYQLTPCNEPEIICTAKQLMAAGKGILAADESGGSIHKKFEVAGIPDDETHRRDYRNIFFTTPEIEKYITGVILFDETARQTADDGRTFTTYLRHKNIIPGIKVDQGLENFPDSPEKYTKGLEGLPERLAEYYDMGARFAKWRAAFELSPTQKPSDMAITKNAEILASYAKDCQNAQIVPIVEPELVYDGDYDITESANYTGKILDALFSALEKAQVDLRGCILKVNMVLAGKQSAVQSTPDEVGRATAETLRAHVPAGLAGVVFLSGGQSVTQATENLQAVTNHGPYPWPVTFSYARALQEPALNAWQGNNKNNDAARAAFKERLVANCAALNKQ